MKLKEISVSYGGTQSLPEYSNTKVSITISATLEDGDDPIAIEAALWQHVKDAVHAQIDRALELNDRPAKYDPSPRFQVLRTYWNQWDHRGETKPPQYIIIAPDAINLDRGAYSQRLISDSRKLRIDHALRTAHTLLGDTDEQYTLLDCSDGDMTPLNLALSAPESNAEYAPTEESPF